MSLIADFKSAWSKVTAGAWSDTAKPTSSQQAIGGFEKDADAIFVVKAAQVAPLIGPAYDVLKAIAARGTNTYLTKAHRDAIAGLVKRFEA